MTNTDDYEILTECQATVECDRCGAEVDLIAETDGWVQDEATGRWLHDGFGPATGDCCGLLYASWWEGTFVYDMDPPSGWQAKADTVPESDECGCDNCRRVT